MATFRTSARTVDMLGRQQIAGVPSAISELFKNAHDAYATNANADFFRETGMLVIRDDGVGMTRDQFETRWLTLGTSAKANPDRQEPPPLGMAPRAVLGEKGIGRLAIAAIGSQTLVLTRSARTAPESPLTVALIHWGAFELQDADLADIAVPILECPEGVRPDLRLLAGKVLDSVRDAAGPDDADLVLRVSSDLELWSSVDLDDLADSLGAPDLVDVSGTCFVVTPTSPDLVADLDEWGDEAAPLIKTLIGFADTMTPNHSPPVLNTYFRDHAGIDDVVDRIDDGDFFTPDEFAAADHRFSGRFDEYGQFTGTVSVFGAAPDDLVVAWPEARGVPTRCGPFNLEIAYVQGKRAETSLDALEHQRVLSKLALYGGLYIYRDGIRVLPYGDNHFDWLDIEVRRSKSASDSFFSHRRMFGAVTITRDQNHGLREKAGREGFATNLAYRQLRSMLINFLVRATNEFFREGGPRADEWMQGRLANERLDKARIARARRVNDRRKALQAELNAFFASVEADGPRLRTRKEISNGFYDRTDILVGWRSRRVSSRQ